MVLLWLALISLLVGMTVDEWVFALRRRYEKGGFRRRQQSKAQRQHAYLGFCASYSKRQLGQEAAKAYLTRITTVESLEFEPGAELCGDDSWMEHINEDCMTDASDSSYPMPFLPYENIGEPFLQMTNL